jgi:hypothetical protein
MMGAPHDLETPMSHPAFFDLVPALTLRDPLADLLGAADDGLIEYHYADAVRLAGHSCPTVAGAWLMTRHALAALYPDGVPERGGLRVQLRDAPGVANAGVVGAVIGLVTGAAGEAGFQGLGGRHGRRGLLEFGVAMAGEVRCARLDTGAGVEIRYRPQAVPPDPALPTLMPAVVAGTASAAERAEFGRLWQDRVRRLLMEAPAGLIEVTPL